MAWMTFFTGAFCGFMLADVLWRFTHRLTQMLVKEQGEYISQLRKLMGLEP